MKHESSLAERLGKIIGVFFRLFLRDPIMMLERSGELVTFAGDGDKLIIGEFPHFSFTFPVSCFQLPAT